MYGKIGEHFKILETHSVIFSRFLFFFNAHPAGATSQDKNLPSVSANLLRWKKPDKDIMINKTAGEKSSLEIKSRLFI